MKLGLLYLLISVILSACASNPVSKQSEFVLMSEKDELSLGLKLATQYNQQLQLLDEKDPLSIYVNEVGQRIAKVADRPELFYHFRVVDDATINAFALPGGHIYIHRGLVNHLNSEAELAAVLGHEIGHVTARHAVRRYTQIKGYQLGMFITSIFVPFQPGMGNMTNLLASSFISGFGRDQELQADQLALEYIPRAHYDATAVVKLLATLHRLEVIHKKEQKDAGEKVQPYHGAFASHPETLQRIQQTRQSHTEPGLINHNRMLAALNGYPYGDSPREGAVVGQRFLHPELELQLKFPERWVLKNTPQAMTARVRQEKVYFQMQIKKLSQRATASQVLQSLFPNKTLQQRTEATILGYPAAHARIDASAPHVSQANIDATVWLKGSQAFIMLMWAPRNKINLYQQDISSIRQSLQKYDLTLTSGIPHIAIYSWKQGDTWSKLAAQSDMILGRFTADRIAALNGMDTTEIPAYGQLIKIVQ
ncbi:MAG: M48 family metalloprotease [Mariprofundaceae bacterium]